MIDPTKPVHPLYCADPAVLRAEDGAYYAFGTAGPGNSGLPADRRFPLLRSTDLEHWELLGGALILPDDRDPTRDHWAPEPARGDDGRYYLYYSVGYPGEMGHKVHVAVSDRPEGPYRDVPGPSLTPEHPFAIDAHPFRDKDGTWYLFYASDFLDTEGGYRAGTGLVMDRLIDMTRLAGEERVVMRARHDWQIFLANRRMEAYGGQVFDWHTLEGAYIVLHEGRYYCFYSGSSYQTAHYGVDYVVADSITGPWSDEGGEQDPRVLREIPGVLRGPGHNSITVGPDGREYLVFHAWDDAFERRQMHVAPLVWTPDGPRADLTLPSGVGDA
jgi:beta-xylosidase